MKREALSHPLAITGIVVTTVSAVVFLSLVIAMIFGLLENPYAGLVVFVAIPAVFLAGLVLIPWGVRLQQRKLLRDPNAVLDWPVVDFRRVTVRASRAMASSCAGAFVSSKPQKRSISGDLRAGRASRTGRKVLDMKWGVLLYAAQGMLQRFGLSKIRRAQPPNGIRAS